jgi:CBS domain-containing protein
MRCEEIMKRDVECLSPGQTVQEAARQMRKENISFLPVCDEVKNVLGTITDRDIAIRLVADGRDASTSIDDIMTREVVACRPQESVQVAERLMAENQKSRIMCTDDDGRLVGVISLSDLAKYERGEQASDTLRKVSSREARA